MDIATIGGIAAAVALTIISIFLSGGNIMNYLDPGSALMTFGGSFAAVFASHPMARSLGVMKLISTAIKQPNYQEEKLIQQLVAFSEKARREGLLALEDDMQEVEDEFMRKGIQLVVDGTDPEIIKTILYTELNQQQARHESGIKYFDDWSKLGPAFGMLGTLAGLIAMLANLSDASSIGKGMGLALITSLYGALLANGICIPIKSKLQERDKAETLVKEITVEGILSIQSGDNPRILEEKLLTFLPPKRREAARTESGKE